MCVTHCHQSRAEGRGMLSGKCLTCLSGKQVLSKLSRDTVGATLAGSAGAGPTPPLLIEESFPRGTWLTQDAGISGANRNQNEASGLVPKGLQ